MQRKDGVPPLTTSQPVSQPNVVPYPCQTAAWRDHGSGW